MMQSKVRQERMPMQTPRKESKKEELRGHLRETLQIRLQVLNRLNLVELEATK